MPFSPGASRRQRRSDSGQIVAGKSGARRATVGTHRARMQTKQTKQSASEKIRMNDYYACRLRARQFHSTERETRGVPGEHARRFGCSRESYLATCGFQINLPVPAQWLFPRFAFVCQQHADDCVKFSPIWDFNSGDCLAAFAGLMFKNKRGFFQFIGRFFPSN